VKVIIPEGFREGLHRRHDLSKVGFLYGLRHEEGRAQTQPEDSPKYDKMGMDRQYDACLLDQKITICQLTDTASAAASTSRC